MEHKTYKCDECGKSKDDRNGWWAGEVQFGASFDYDIGFAFAQFDKRNFFTKPMDYCSRTCLGSAILRYQDTAEYGTKTSSDLDYKGATT